MTPADLNARLEAQSEHDRKEWFRTAWLASKIVSHIVQKSVSVSDLLPEMFPPHKWTEEEVKKELDELKKSLGVE